MMNLCELGVETSFIKKFQFSQHHYNSSAKMNDKISTATNWADKIFHSFTQMDPNL